MVLQEGRDLALGQAVPQPEVAEGQVLSGGREGGPPGEQPAEGAEEGTDVGHQGR
jgi:hypothetical protein